MSSLNPTSQAILRTLAYFDVFDYPLRAEEVWRWLAFQPETVLRPDVAEVQSGLVALEAEGRVARQDDWWYLVGREDIVRLRQERLADNNYKWQRAKTAARYLMVAPFVDMVAVVNTVAINNAKPASDIDVLIVVRAGQLWLARAFVTGIIHLLGYRRHGRHITNRICLSFYVTDQALDLESYAKGSNDVHYRFWTSQAVPLLDRRNTYNRYRQANQWITRWMPNAFEWDWQSRLLPGVPGLGLVQRILETGFSSPFGLWINQWLEDQQRAKMDRNISSRQHQADSDVVIGEDILKFHEADRRQKYNEQYNRRCQALGIEP